LRIGDLQEAKDVIFVIGNYAGVCLKNVHHSFKLGLAEATLVGGAARWAESRSGIGRNWAVLYWIWRVYDKDFG
jgi:hypothetical protein